MLHSAATKSVLNAARQSVSRSTIRPVVVRGYHENVISHYEKPRNVNITVFSTLDYPYLITAYSPPIQVGSLPKGDIDVGTGLVGAPAYVATHYSSCRVDFMHVPFAAAETS